MGDVAANKQIVRDWLSLLGSDLVKAAAQTTADFRWTSPQSMAAIFPGAVHEVRDLAGLRALVALGRRAYREDVKPTVEMHFMIGEGDYVVMQQRMSTVAKNGRPYSNIYCFVFRLVDGKIAEVWEHADTLYSYGVLKGA